MATRYSAGEGLSNPDQPQTRQGDNDKSIPAPAQHPRGAIRVLYNTEDGTTRVMESHTTGGVVSPSVEQASARDRAGNPISLSSAGPNDVVTINGSDTLASVWEGMGMLKRSARGGYEVIGAAPDAPKPAPKANEPAKAEETQPAGDVTGVPPVSDASDVLLADMQSNAPAGLDAVIESISKNIDPSNLYEELGRQMGDEQFEEKAAAMHGEFITSGQAALSRVGVTDFDAFTSWVQAERKNESNGAIRDLVVGKSVARLQDLGRAFVKQNNDRLATIIQSHGVDTQVRDGNVYVSRKGLGLPPTPKVGDFGGSDFMLLREALRAGYIEINQ